MNLLVTGAWQCTEQQLNDLRAMGHTVQFMQDEKAGLPCAESWPEGIICNGFFLHHPIERLPNLRYIQLTAAGLDRVPLNSIRARGIELRNARGVYSIPMAEFALCGVLQLYKQSRFFTANQQQHRWQKHRGLTELADKHAVIVGCGSVGTECAKRFAAFGCRVTGVDLYPREDACYQRMDGPDRLDDALAAADIVVLTLPLKQETRHLMDARRLALLRDSAVLVNIARGALVDTAALLANLPRIAGAVLDVFEEEPLPADSPMWDAENVILTPHNSFVSDGDGARLAAIIYEGLRENP